MGGIIYKLTCEHPGEDHPVFEERLHATLKGARDVAEILAAEGYADGDAVILFAPDIPGGKWIGGPYTMAGADGPYVGADGDWSGQPARVAAGGLSWDIHIYPVELGE